MIKPSLLSSLTVLIYVSLSAPNAGSESVSAPPAIIAAKHVRKPAPLKRLNFSARQGFALKMISQEVVTAELRNGVGRTLARASYNLEAGDWKLHPKNLTPGLYTVLLRTGNELRSMRMKIEDVERGQGAPEWILERAAVDSTVPEKQGLLPCVPNQKCST